MKNDRRRLPRVVVAGRPNVGKSTLFNRLYGRRRAITDPTPGVTRDAIEEDCSLAGIPVTLVDTGGVKAEFSDAFDDIVADRSISSLRSADLILFLVENGELTPEDELLVDVLRSRTDRVVLVVNKVDTPEKEYQAAEFYSLGLGEPIPVSAAHGRNMDRLAEIVRGRLEAVIAAFPDDEGSGISDGSDEEETDPEIVVALVGKPNAGKSTLSNRICGGEASLVSEIAGTTRDTVSGRAEHKGRRLRVIDTAGMRRRAKVAENVEYYSVNRAVKAMFEADVTVLLIDTDEGLTEQDKKITAQAVKKGKTVVMALNKWDEKVPNKVRLKKAVDRVRFLFPVLDWAPIVPVSALEGHGVAKLLDTVVKADRQQNRRVDTAELNRAVSEWVDLTPPPTKKGRPFKVRYVTQVSVKPVRFVAFVNRKNGFPDSYRRFLINQVRREFGFDLVPVEMELREGRK